MYSTNLSLGPSVDNLVARRTGPQRLVSIPGFQELSESRQAAICAELDQSQDTPALDAAALQARLQSLSSVPATGPSLPSSPSSSLSTAPTTPPDPENETKRYHLLEEQARNQLEQDGCPPCYPPDPSFSIRDPPKEYRGIISYWDTFPSSEGGVLCAQREDWYRFRNFQKKNRHYFVKRLAQFTNVVRERRQRHHLLEDVRLCSNPKEQTRVETWVEFQDYHLHAHEDLEKKAEVESQNLHAAIENLQRVVDSKLELAARCKEAYSVRLASAIQRAELHKKHLLPWIEQQRIEMATVQPATANEINGIRRTPIPGNRSRKSSERSVLNLVRSAVSKPNTRKRSLRSRRSKFPPRPEDSTFDFSTSQSSTLQMPNLRRKEPQRIRGSAPLRPPHPQKVTKPVKRDSKSKRQVDIDTCLRQSPQSHKVEQWKPKQRGSLSLSRSVQQHLTEDFVTRSGRMSRRPRRPVFVSYS